MDRLGVLEAFDVQPRGTGGGGIEGVEAIVPTRSLPQGREDISINELSFIF